MIRLLRLPILIGLIASLSACASLQDIDASPDRMKLIESITVLRHPQELRYAVQNQGGVAGAFGALGAMIESADRTAKENTLLETLQPLGLRVHAALADELASRLRDRGYVVKVEDAPPVILDIGKKAGYDRLPTTSDAVLIALPEMVGFVSPVGATVYYPTVLARVDLVARDRTTSLYRGSHATGWQPYGGWKFAASTAEFPNFGDLTKDPRASADALLAANRAIADSIVSQIPARSPEARRPAADAPATQPRRAPAAR